jgi:Telomere resolvase
MKKWLTSLLNLYLPMVEHLANDQAGTEAAAAAALWMKQQWVARGLDRIEQQRNPMTETRNFLKEKLGEGHVSLISMNFTTEQWRQINNVSSDRVETRNENQKLITNAQAIVDRAVELIESHDWAEIAAGLAVLVGRRVTEVLSTMQLEFVTEYSVQFTGALKRRGEPVELSFEIPTLCPAELVLRALTKLRGFVDTTGMNPGEVNAHYGAAVIRAGDKHFHDLIPLREGRDSLYTHLYRTIYAVIATHWYCPPGVTAMTFKAQVQGHFQVLEAPTDEIRRSYAASRHYDDYAIGTEQGELDGRHGIKLGLPGVRILGAFQKKKTADTQSILDDADQGVIADLTTHIQQEPITVGKKTGVKVDQEQAPQPISQDSQAHSTNDQTHGSATNDQAKATTEKSTNDQAQDTTTRSEVPADDQAKTPSKKSKGKAVPFRVWTADRSILEALKAQLGSEATQADTISHLINLANITLQLSGDWQVPVEEVQAKATELLQTTKVQTHHIDAFQKQIQQQKERIDTLTTQNAQLQKQLAELKADKGKVTSAAAVSGAVLGSAIAGEGNEGIQAVLSLAAAALNLAQTIAANHSGVGATSITTSQPLAAPITTTTPGQPGGDTTATNHGKRRNQKKTPSTATAPSTPTSLGNGAATTTATPTTNYENAPLSGMGSGLARIHRAVIALMAFNDRQTQRTSKWAINQNSIEKLTGAFRANIKKYIAEHGQEIQAHNHLHGLTDFHNIAKGRAGHDIKKQIVWENDAMGNTPQASKN